MWIKEWHGLERLSDAWIDKGQLESSEWHHEIETLCQLFERIPHNSITFLELGAGWGEWCLAATGIIRNNIVKTKIKNVYCIGVEAEPTHYKWLQESFTHNKIDGRCVHAVVSDKIGESKFTVTNHPETEYGQSSELPIYKQIGLRLLNLGKTQTIQCVTIDNLLLYGKNPVFIHCDIQGSELKAFQGASKSLDNGKICALMVGIHKMKFTERIPKLMDKNGFQQLYNYFPNTEYNIGGKNVAFQDGLQVYTRY